jgi:hypothetical protein
VFSFGVFESGIIHRVNHGSEAPGADQINGRIFIHSPDEIFEYAHGSIQKSGIRPQFYEMPADFASNAHIKLTSLFLGSP